MKRTVRWRNCAHRIVAGSPWGLAVAIPGTVADLTFSIEPRRRQDLLAIPSAVVKNAARHPGRSAWSVALISGVSRLRADAGNMRLDGQLGAIDAGRGRLGFTVHGMPKGG